MRNSLRLAALALLTLAPLSVQAQETSGSFSEGAVLIGYDNRTCDGTLEGSIRYDSASKSVEFCDSVDWTRMVGTITSGPVAPAGSGFIVLTQTTYDGNLGGITGANAECLTELTTNTAWKNHAVADGNGQLIANKVKALICSNNATCNNAIPLATYFFAAVGDVNAGGASFTADSSGLGPGDSVSWAAANYFGQAATYWMGRSSNGGSSSTLWHLNGGNFSGGCSGFRDNTGAYGATGQAVSTGSGRYYITNTGLTSCANSYQLVCLVHP